MTSFNPSRERAGWKLVPVEPTAEMISAAMPAPTEWIGHQDASQETIARWREGHGQAATRHYAAMLAAAPSPDRPTNGGRPHYVPQDRLERIVRESADEIAGGQPVEDVLRGAIVLALSAPSPAALPSPTSGEEGGGEAFDIWWKSLPYTDRAEHHDWFARIAFEAGQETLAKPASEPAGGGRREAEIARWKRDSELLSAIQDECWDVRFTSSPNADAGDYNVNIEIVGHFMAEPQERVVGENYNEDLRAALEQAITAEPYPPARPVYDKPAALSSPAPSPAEAEALPAGVEAVRVVDWLTVAKSAGTHGIRYRTNQALEAFLTEIAAALSSAPAPAEIVAIEDGAPIILRLFGRGHPPVMMRTGDAPDGEGIRTPARMTLPGARFRLDDRVRKLRGSSWQGLVVGFYSTRLTPIGYAVESEREPGSVQIYPESALELVPEQAP